MKFDKRLMSKSELIREGFPEAFLDSIWNTPHQTIAFKAGEFKQSKILFDTSQLNALINEETEREQARRGII